MNKKFKTKLIFLSLFLFSLSFAGCEQNFFVSPLELLTPIVTPTEMPSFTPGANQTAAPSTTPSNTPSLTPIPTDTPTPSATSTPIPTLPPYTSTPTPTITPTPTPTDIPSVQTVWDTPVTDPADYTFLVNREHALASDYVPEDLTYISHAANTNSSEDKYMMRRVAAEAFDALCDAAYSEKELSIVGVSGYRSYERQYNLYAGYLIRDGISGTNYYSAAPGTSEHQSGLAIDISCKSCGYDLVNSFAKSKEGEWVAENAWRFGFIIRYAESKVDITGYAYEPWHIRYVGIPLAYYLYMSGLTLEEYYDAPSTTSREYLDSTPLIDTSSPKFGKLYLDKLGNIGTLLYDTDKTSLKINTATFMPYVIPYVLSEKGSVQKDTLGLPFTAPVIKDADGKMFADATGKYILVKKALFVDGKLYLDADNNPYFLEPVLNADGTMLRDSDGNVIFNDVLLSPDQKTVVTGTDGLPIPLVPMRTAEGSVITNWKGVPLYYDAMSAGNEYITYDNGDIVWYSGYSQVKELNDSIAFTESGNVE